MNKEKENDTSLGFSYGFYLKGEPQKGFIAAIKYSFYKFFSTICFWNNYYSNRNRYFNLINKFLNYNFRKK